MPTKGKRPSARAKVYDGVRSAILNGEWKVGQRIGEVALAEEFKVSRAVIREALQQLAHEGLVEQNGYKGTRVVHLAPEQIDEITSVRVVLEVEAIHQARQRLTVDNKDELRTMARRVDAAAEKPELYAQLDLALHERIWEMSGNRILKRMLHQVTAPLFALGTLNRHSRIFLTNHPVGNLDRSKHTDLIETICEGAADEAADAMRRHIYYNWPAVRRSFAEFLETAGVPGASGAARAD